MGDLSLMQATCHTDYLDSICATIEKAPIDELLKKYGVSTPKPNTKEISIEKLLFHATGIL